MNPARILVIDDNELDVVLLRHALDKHGEDYELEILSDGDSALRFVREHRTKLRQPEPCVILLDLYLPAHDGIAVLRAIREAPALEHIQVLVLTSLASPSQEMEIASMGAHYRKKPEVLDELTALATEIFALCNGQVVTA